MVRVRDSTHGNADDLQSMAVEYSFLYVPTYSNHYPDEMDRTRVRQRLQCGGYNILHSSLSFQSNV
jgi:hypothetical protein